LKSIQFLLDVEEEPVVRYLWTPHYSEHVAEIEIILTRLKQRYPYQLTLSLLTEFYDRGSNRIHSIPSPIRVEIEEVCHRHHVRYWSPIHVHP
jgi:hypothetical protein